ncbi:MAG: PcfB family protein [Clostridiales bacterium]|nr:PcfB family protein [Clostridiales bacterium]
MQDEVNEKVVSLAIKTSKLTAGVLQSAIKALLKKGKGQLTKAPHGKVTMRQLMKPGEKVTNIEITDANIKAFDPIAKKNGLTYNVKKIENGKPPTYLVSFRGKDIDVMTEAFREFSSKKLSREQKPSIRKALAAFRDKAKQLNANREKVKKKERGIDR